MKKAENHGNRMKMAQFFKNNLQSMIRAKQTERRITANISTSAEKVNLNLPKKQKWREMIEKALILKWSTKYDKNVKQNKNEQQCWKVNENILKSRKVW